MLVLEWKERAFIEKVNSRCFCWFPAAILVYQNGTPIWRLHTNVYKGAWNVSANNSETVGHKDLRLGRIVYIHFLASSTGRFPIYFFSAVFIAWQWKRSIRFLARWKIFFILGVFLNHPTPHSKGNGRLRKLSIDFRISFLWLKGYGF